MRCTPTAPRSPQRWLTSTLLHQSFMHMLSNSLMLLGFGGQLEVKHGNWRTAALALLSALGGGFLRCFSYALRPCACWPACIPHLTAVPKLLRPACSAATEAPCVAVVGASGIVFGLAAACIADMVLNFETLARPLLRTAVLLAFLIFFAVTVGTTAAGTSHMSHVGGFLAGLAGGLVLLPNPQRGRCEAAATAAGAAGLLALLTAAPLVFYLKLLPRVCCGC